MAIDKKTVLVFDVDSTLTPPRQPINETMTAALQGLRVPFFVAAGSHLSLLRGQFFQPLYDLGFRKQFDAFLSNGAVQYRCDYSRGLSIELVSEFNLRAYLGDEDYQSLAETLARTLELAEFKLPPSLQVLDGRVVDRVSMINLCPIGRLEQEDAEAQRNRENFVNFDRAHGYRGKILDHLNRELKDLRETKQLKITLGGQTSFDIGVVGQDKTKPLRLLVRGGFERIVFIGDALFAGGNDAAVTEFIADWPAGSDCPVEAVQVNSWQETLNILRSRQYVD